MDAIATVALLEETDQLLGKNHLFKRSLLLIKVILRRQYPVAESLFVGMVLQTRVGRQAGRLG